jgi:hypothetical protein
MFLGAPAWSWFFAAHLEGIDNRLQHPLGEPARDLSEPTAQFGQPTRRGVSRKSTRGLGIQYLVTKKTVAKASGRVAILNRAVAGYQQISRGPVPDKLIAVRLAISHDSWAGRHLQLVPDVELRIPKHQSVRRSSDKLDCVKRCIHGAPLDPTNSHKFKAIVALRSNLRLATNQFDATCIISTDHTNGWRAKWVLKNRAAQEKSIVPPPGVLNVCGVDHPNRLSTNHLAQE